MKELIWGGWMGGSMSIGGSNKSHKSGSGGSGFGVAPEIHSSNPVVGKFYLLPTLLKRQN